MRTNILERIASERAGCIIDRGLLKSILSMLVDVGVDENVYEVGLILSSDKRTRRFFPPNL